MTDLVAITGTGDITYENAEALLSDYLPEDVTVYVPSYMTSNGIRVVVQWLKDAGINFERVKRHLMNSYLAGMPGDNKVLIVLGIEGSEEIIKECLGSIPVLDLTRGLWMVSPSELQDSEESQRCLSGSESDSETFSVESGTSLSPQDQERAEVISEPQTLEEALEEIAKLRKKVDELTSIVGETNWEPNGEFIGQKAQQELYDKINGPEKTKYYQNGKGKIRKAGRSKIKPGEKEVYLTEEEVELLSNS